MKKGTKIAKFASASGLSICLDLTHFIFRPFSNAAACRRCCHPLRIVSTMFGGFGGGAPQRFEECYHCYSVAYADKSHLEVSCNQLQSKSGRQAGCWQETGPHGFNAMNGSHFYHGFSSTCWLLLCILCIGHCPSTCISYHSSSLGISLSSPSARPTDNIDDQPT